MKSYNLLILLAVLFVSDYAFSQTCPCDTLELKNGKTGNDIVEFLCPDGSLSPEALFEIGPIVNGGVIISGTTITHDITGYTSISNPGFRVCEIVDGAFGNSLEITEQEYLNCRARLINGCDLKRIAPIPTLSEWGMIAAVAGLMLVGVFFAVRRRKAQPL